MKSLSASMLAESSEDVASRRAFIRAEGLEPVSRRPATVTQTEVARLIKGVRAGGVNLERILEVEMTPDRVVIRLGEPDPEKSGDRTTNEWDEVLRR